MRTLLFLILFVLVLLGALVATTPLGYILQQSGVGSVGFGWAKVDGTLVKGRISGFYVGTQPLGDITLELRPMSLLTLQPTYDIQWGGAGGRGTGVLTLSQNKLTGREIRMQQEISALESLDPAVRMMGGSLRLSEGMFVMTQTGCEDASGTLSTDTLSTLAAQYGRQFGTISGPISCEAGGFAIDMSGESDTGDRVDIDAKAYLPNGGEFTTTIETQDAQIVLALSQVGFEREDGRFVYHRSQAVGLP